MKVGVQLPEIERVVRWPELAEMARAIEAGGFDSIWVGDLLLFRHSDGVVGPWDVWSVLAALATWSRPRRCRSPEQGCTPT